MVSLCASSGLKLDGLWADLLPVPWILQSRIDKVGL